MAKGNGSTRKNPYSAASKGTIAISSSGKRITQSDIKAIGSIGDMAHRDMEKEINQAISRYESVMGVRERNIQLADIPGAYGAAFIGPDGSHGIYLNRSKFDVPKKDFVKEYVTSNYARRNGFKNTTRNPAQHTVTHELAHATWTSGYTSQKAKDAGKEIKALYNTFLNDKSSSRKKNYGSYGTKNVDEFWAETITKGIHGDNDAYTRKAMKIAKKYKL